MTDNCDVGEELRKYDMGELDEARTSELFQHLIDAEIVWMLQEHYGCVAKSLIQAGKCHEAYCTACS